MDATIYAKDKQPSRRRATLHFSAHTLVTAGVLAKVCVKYLAGHAQRQHLDAGLALGLIADVPHRGCGLC